MKLLNPSCDNGMKSWLTPREVTQWTSNADSTRNGLEPRCRRQTAAVLMSSSLSETPTQKRDAMNAREISRIVDELFLADRELTTSEVQLIRTYLGYSAKSETIEAPKHRTIKADAPSEDLRTHWDIIESQK